MKKTLVRTRIDLVDHGTAMVLFFWKPRFKRFLPSIFGRWYSFGTTCCHAGIEQERIDKVTDDNVSDILFDNFILDKKPGLDYDELIADLRRKWSMLYERCRKGEVPNKDYARRRRSYENIIWELLFLKEGEKDSEGIGDEMKGNADFYNHLKGQVEWSKKAWDERPEDMSLRAWYDALNWAFTEYTAIVGEPPLNIPRKP